MIVELPVVESVLERHASQIGADLAVYRNHVYRVINLVHAIQPLDTVDMQAVAVAAVFHDIGLWTAGTWDYLPPSIAAAQEWLAENGLTALSGRVRDMIENHHKLLPCRSGADTRVEHFRRADWCDVSGGLRAGDIKPECYREIRGLFPSEGFHRRLLDIGLRNAWRFPLRPLPMFRL